MELLSGMREKRIEIIITCLSHVHIFTPLWCLHFMFDEPKEWEGARACTYAKQKKMILIEFEMMFFATYFQFRFILPHTYIALEWIVVSVICVAVLHPFLWIFYASNCYFRWKEEEEGERKKNTRQTVKNNSANNIHRYTQYTFHFDAINQSGTYHPIDDDNKCVFFFCSLPSPCYVFFSSSSSLVWWCLRWAAVSFSSKTWQQWKQTHKNTPLNVYSEGERARENRRNA